MKKLLLFLMIAGVYVVHQDNWDWNQTGLFFNSFPAWLQMFLNSILFINPHNGLVFGILPVGLAYHAGYSILAAVMMAVLVKFAWPRQLEQSGQDKSAEKKKDEDGK